MQVRAGTGVVPLRGNHHLRDCGRRKREDEDRADARKKAWGRFRRRMWAILVFPGLDRISNQYFRESSAFITYVVYSISAAYWIGESDRVPAYSSAESGIGKTLRRRQMGSRI